MISLPLLICLLGLLFWIIFSKTKLSDPLAAEAGRIAFAFGLLVTLLAYAGKSLF